MSKLYASAVNLYAMELLCEGPVSATLINATNPGHGFRVLERFEDHGLIEYSHKSERGQAFFKLTIDGRVQAAVWNVRAQALRRGECCEDAILGIEGDHAPYCPFAGATPAGSR